MLSAATLFLHAQNSNFNYDSAFEKTAQLIVMLKADYGETQEFGAGIVFGREKDRLLIVTAYHIFKGAEQPKDIAVQFRSMPRNKYLPAKLLRYEKDENLDVAVLSVENLKEQGIDACSMPFDRLGKLYKIKRGDLAYAVGNPNGVSWAMPVAADRISQINGDLIDFQSNFISKGHSGGGLLDEKGDLIGMTIADAQPFGRAINLGAILSQMKKWQYPVQLDTSLPGKWTPLHMAAYKGDIAAIKFHLTDCGDPNIVNAHNATPLHCAAASENVEALSILLKAGANPNILDNDGDLPLEWAIEKDCFECVKLLVNGGTKLNIRNKKGQIVLHIAIDSGQQKTALLLIKSGADVNSQYNGADDDDDVKKDFNSPLYHAVNKDNTVIVEALLKAGANANAINKTGMTPLYIAVEKNNIEIARMLLKAGAKPDLGQNYNIPLHAAVKNRNIEIIKLLRAHGANINILDYGGTSLQVAIYKYKWEKNKRNSLMPVIKTLIELGADVNVSGDNQRRPIMDAIFDDADTDGGELLKLLIKAGAKVGVPDKYGNTPLHLAIEELTFTYKDLNDLVYVKALLNEGADPTIKNRQEVSPFDKIKFEASSPEDTSYNYEWEQMSLEIELLKLFIKAGAKLNAHDNKGLTPLYKAVESCLFGSKDPVFIVMLLNAGADPNLKNKDGKTPMDSAKSFRNEKIINLLKQYGGK